ncbi:alpha/beta fold hydrolase [Jiangella asiatica]|uniref:Alpha/beta hydrolase n=1 Tax=Jiangella asiatica TaxID=2530372 RepID=A0A4R5CN42_9ACTN|nr:alpha/beta hydrolase [Jiangella asiatica]TDE00757.1 alpha/beta hydrolase [Jiangella asiatica]
MTLAFRTHGEGRPLVALPWFGLDGAALAAALEPAVSGHDGWRRVYVDLPGTGGSPGGVPTSDAVVDEVLAFVDDELAGEPFALAGCSYGGYVATAMARRAPERVRGLLLVCSGEKIIAAERELPPPDLGDAGGDGGSATSGGWLAGVPGPLADHLATALGRRTAAVAERVAAVIAAAPPSDEEYLERLRSTGYRLSDEGEPFRYPGPTAVLTGRQDRVAGYADQFRALSNYPDAGFAVVPDAGHYLPFEQPAVFRDLVGHWLARLA